jgi:hypothetical protein
MIEAMKENIEEINRGDIIENDLGFVLWKLESIENFYPCYKSMIKKD